ncbi:hypothetical protein A4A49_58230 [Nicotiana attenuata]|uniref:Uncharacterized protein n=1 Tax=Nicotiana attenuata TaxID=49451 RepID=A0A314KWN1_NICAT|nr:hypothetical protein A4A49_58230 [Nicotiana attenuata]
MNARGWIEDEFYPWFGVDVPSSYIKRDYVFLPKSIFGYLPPISIKTMLRYNGKEWAVTSTSGVRRRLVNNLKKGGVLLLELAQATSGAVVFSVEVLGQTNV